ncbi:MAG: CorA family divalent cation transporter [Candidatus Micrarchaeota archaeon]|nr:CorA family divalent cation transporter [Candidatus Micrarchaeota archaeon]
MYHHLAKKVKVKSENSDGIILALEHKGFCAALLRRETTSRHSQDISDFSPLIEKCAIAWVDYVVDDFRKDAPRIAERIGFSSLLVKNLTKNSRSGYEDFNNEMGLLIPAIHVENFEVKLDPLLVLIRKNLILTIHTSGTKRFFRVRRYAETLLRKLPAKMMQKDKLTLLLIRILDENNARNFDYLQVIEEQGDKISHDLSDHTTSRKEMGNRIYQMKHALTVYLLGLWATVDALNSLRYGDADLLTDNPKIIGRLTGLVGEVHSQIGLAEHLSDVLASGLEVLQSIYNNQLQILNNQLAMAVAYMTILGTALLVPNTIATVMASPAFDLGTDDFNWYVSLIIASTVVSTFIAWFAVDKMGLLPKRYDENK